VLVVAEDDDRIEVGSAQDLAELLDGALYAGVLLAEAVDLELRVEILGNVATYLLGLAEVGPLLGEDGNLRSMRVSDAQHHICHILITV
jgi:hypothetical protein